MNLLSDDICMCSVQLQGTQSKRQYYDINTFLKSDSYPRHSDAVVNASSAKHSKIAKAESSTDSVLEVSVYSTIFFDIILLQIFPRTYIMLDFICLFEMGRTRNNRQSIGNSCSQWNSNPRYSDLEADAI